MLAPKNTPAAAPTAGRSHSDGFGNHENHIHTKARPQLKRHGDTSSMLAFVDDANGRPLGWLARGKGVWNAVRAGSGDAYAFPTALHAFRYLIGGRL